MPDPACWPQTKKQIIDLVQHRLADVEEFALEPPSDACALCQRVGPHDRACEVLKLRTTLQSVRLLSDALPWDLP